jgi:DHA3 family macrolide efflux protein-like MFS transporter
MLMFKAIQNRAVRSLWLGQLTSHIGDEIYKVAFIWLAIDVAGANTGLFGALQYVSVLAFGILGGKWSDRWKPYQTMMITDLIRAILTLTPVLFYYLEWPSFGALLVSSILISGFGAFFEPALQTALPQICKDRLLLKGANGLLSTSYRLARVLGPAIIGLLANLILTIHYFTLNALSFLISAIAIHSTKGYFRTSSDHHEISKETVLKNFSHSYQLLKDKNELFLVIMMKTIAGGTWGLTYGLGLALMMREFSGNDVQSFGLVMGAYGLGNVIAALIVGNMERKNSSLLVYIGLIWLGAGFIGIGASYSLPLILFFSAFTAIGGPLNDLPCIDMIQNSYSSKDIPRIFRLKMTFDNLAALILLLISPVLFHFFSIRSIIIACGFMTILAGAIGIQLHQSLPTRSLKNK